MSSHATLPGNRNQTSQNPGQSRPRAKRSSPAVLPFRFAALAAEGDSSHHQAELFYLQKQIHSQTPMVFVLEDGEQVEGCIEWYDRNSLKVRGRTKTLIYKSAIKYMYKLGDSGP